MRIEIKDIDPRDAAAFIQDVIDELEITEAQAASLETVIRRHQMGVNIWVDSSGCHNASPNSY